MSCSCSRSEGLGEVRENIFPSFPVSLPLNSESPGTYSSSCASSSPRREREQTGCYQRIWHTVQVTPHLCHIPGLALFHLVPPSPPCSILPAGLPLSAGTPFPTTVCRAAPASLTAAGSARLSTLPESRQAHPTTVMLVPTARRGIGLAHKSLRSPYVVPLSIINNVGDY